VLSYLDLISTIKCGTGATSRKKREWNSLRPLRRSASFFVPLWSESVPTMAHKSNPYRGPATGDTMGCDEAVGITVDTFEAIVYGKHHL
jgi:hypothetical protein